MQYGHILNQHFGFLFLDDHFVEVEPCAFDVHAGNIPSIFGLAGDLGGVSISSNLGVDGEFVEFERVLLAELLAEADHVGVGDVDAGEPGAVGLALDPLVVLLDASAQVHHPRGQFLVRLRRQFLPRLRDEAVEDVVLHDLQVVREADDAVDHVQDVFQVPLDADDEFVDSLDFLFEHHCCELETRVFRVIHRLVNSVFDFVLFLRIL